MVILGHTHVMIVMILAKHANLDLIITAYHVMHLDTSTTLVAIPIVQVRIYSRYLMMIQHIIVVLVMKVA
jgi:hypothetical protein